MNLSSAINSIFKQTYKNWELIFFDNASKDNSAKIIKSYKDKRIKYYYQENYGPASARNNGIKNSSGQILHFFDSDDIAAPNKQTPSMLMALDKYIKEANKRVRR